MRNLSLSPESVEEYQRSWLNALPTELGDLFCYETPQGMLRYDSYQLPKVQVEDILEIDDSTATIQSFSIIMGKKSLDSQSIPSTFQPILEVSTKDQGKVINHFYILERVQKPFNSFGTNGIARNASSIDAQETQELSPKVAELFILNWQCLNSPELVAAFEGISPEQLFLKEQDGNIIQELIGVQKSRRVINYTFDFEETKKIVEALKRSIASNPTDTPFNLLLGAGLLVPLYHPFNFRPIININIPGESESQEDPIPLAVPIFFDTSRPCPPFCDPSLGIIQPL